MRISDWSSDVCSSDLPSASWSASRPPDPGDGMDDRSRFDRLGYLHLPGFLGSRETTRFRAICDRMLDRWRAEGAGRGRSTNMAFLTEPRWFRGREDELPALLELVAEPRALADRKSTRLNSSH